MSALVRDALLSKNYAGTATAGTSTSLTDSGKNFDSAGYGLTGVHNTAKGCTVKFTSGANSGQTRTVTSNTATALSWASALPNAVQAGDSYEVWRYMATTGLPMYGALVGDDSTRHAKRLFVVVATDDAAEHSGGWAIRGMVDYLLSGTAGAQALLNSFTFLFALWSQTNIRIGKARVGQDAKRDATTGDLVPCDPWATLYSGGDVVATENLKIAIQNWIAQGGGSDFTPIITTGSSPGSGPVVAMASIHCNGNGDDISKVIYPPYFNIDVFSHTIFRGSSSAPAFDSTVYPEFYKPTTDIASGSWPGEADTKALVHNNGGCAFYAELPWRGPSHKESYWPDADAFQNFGVAFLQGLGVAGGAGYVYSETPQDTATSATAERDGFVIGESVADSAQGTASEADLFRMGEQPVTAAASSDSGVTQQRMADAAVASATGADVQVVGTVLGEPHSDAAQSFDAGSDQLILRQSINEGVTDAARASDTAADALTAHLSENASTAASASDSAQDALSARYAENVSATATASDVASDTTRAAVVYTESVADSAGASDAAGDSTSVRQRYGEQVADSAGASDAAADAVRSPVSYAEDMADTATALDLADLPALVLELVLEARLQRPTLSAELCRPSLAAVLYRPLLVTKIVHKE